MKTEHKAANENREGGKIAEIVKVIGHGTQGKVIRIENVENRWNYESYYRQNRERNYKNRDRGEIIFDMKLNVGGTQGKE